MCLHPSSRKLSDFRMIYTPLAHSVTVSCSVAIDRSMVGTVGWAGVGGGAVRVCLSEVVDSVEQVLAGSDWDQHINERSVKVSCLLSLDGLASVL
jgi:hypothetical protein